MGMWGSNSGENYVSLDDPVHGPRRRLIGRVVLALGAVGCLGAVALKSHGGNAVESLVTTATNAATSPRRSALGIKAKRSDDLYAPLSSYLLGAYMIDMLVEPHVEMRLELDGCEDDSNACADVTWSALPVEQDIKGTVDFDTATAGSSVLMTFKVANSKFRVQAMRGAEVLAVAEASVKYVRRDIYSLSQPHREQYFAAMQTLFTTSQEEGEALYGRHFFSHGEMTSLHDASNVFYHGNLFFLTSHPVMQLKLERALLAIDPTVSLPYWDFLLDTKLGKDWASSQIYDESWFGPVSTLESNKFRVTGRFEDVKKVYDPNSTAYPNSKLDAYGFLGGKYNTNYDVHLQRSDSYCGFKSIQGQSTCEHVSTCFETFESENDLYAWDTCMEQKVHANLHTMHAGQWDCAVSWQEYFSENKEWVDPLLLSILGLNVPVGTDMASNEGYVTCSTASSCHLGGSCGCTSAIRGISSADDVDALSFDDTFEKTQAFWQYVYEGALQGSEWVVYRDNYHGYSKAYVPLDRSGKEMSKAQFDSLNKLLFKTILFTGKLGHMVSGAAAEDPLFWVMHQVFDKAFHALVLSPRYNKNGFTWNNADGFLQWNGTAGTTVFKAEAFEPWLGKTDLAKATNSASGDFLTNQELWALLHPHSNAIPYVYDQMTTWGDCSFDPLGN